jgi:hypothetical protein
VRTTFTTQTRNGVDRAGSAAELSARIEFTRIDRRGRPARSTSAMAFSSSRLPMNHHGEITSDYTSTVVIAVSPSAPITRDRRL